ncbi:MAG TPA: hypothetical protein VNU68_30885 [Verrucomicrobiae bacterium]|nr:hypothetical protein [Verrucomicrobiae bacterium]
MEAFAWDLETNAYDSKTFTVRHERYTREGATKLTDPRDIYEHVANFAARRKRACMEAVIPRDVIDAAVEQCDATLKQGHSEPLVDRVRKMTSAFAEFSVTVDMLERRLQHKLDAVNEQEMVILRKIYTSLKDGMGRREDFFNLTEGPKPAKFDKSDETVADAKAEAAAGLAPANRVDAPAPSAAAASGASAQVAPAAPATPPTASGASAPPQTAAAKARAARKTAMTAPGQDPTPTMTAPAPAPAAAQPVAPPTPVAPAPAPAPVPSAEPTPAPAPVAPAGDLFNGGAAPASAQESQALAARAYEAIAANKVTEEEVLQFLKSRKICPENIEQIVQLADDIVVDLIENIAPVAAQVRINRKFTGKK